MGGQVMKARKKCDVGYPLNYATQLTLPDGKVATNAKDEKHAELFNCYQRAHGNCQENASSMALMAVVGGFLYPVAAAVGLLCWTIGASIYFSNYSSGGPKKRNSGLALIKYVGLFTLLGSNFLSI